MKNVHEDELQFVAKHYKEGRLNKEAAWEKLQQRVGKRRHTEWRRYAVAASVVLVAGMAISGVAWVYNQGNSVSAIEEPVLKSQSDSTKVFYYDKMPVNNVLKDLSSYYGVTLVASDTTKCVSGELEASGLDEMIDILEKTIDIEIEKK